jgi:hypothetical protein
MTLEAFELLIGKVVQTDSSGTILEPLAPATAAAKLCFTGLLFFLFQGWTLKTNSGSTEFANSGANNLQISLFHNN